MDRRRKLEELKIFIADNPQVTASMITAICGILGIFINIAINLCFRNRDYKKKSRMQQIENMELYYLPLCEKIEHIIEFVRNLKVNDEVTVFGVLSGQMDASYAKNVKMIENSLEDLQKYFEEGTYKVQDDYKLFEIHRKVKNNVWKLRQYSENGVKSTDEISVRELINECEELVYRIRCCEVRVMIDNVFCKIRERIIIWKNYKKRVM